MDPAVLAAWKAWIADLSERLDTPDPEEVVDETVAALHGERVFDGGPAAPPFTTLSASHALIESDWYGEHDEAEWAARRPFNWLWRQFDASPWAANEAFAIPFRAMLAKRVFRACGESPRIFGGVTWSCGYRVTLGDRVVLHRGVLLDDRGGLEIGDDCSISDDVQVYSHRHAVDDIGDVTLEPTRIGARTRVTVGARILSGITVGEDALVGAGALVTRDVGVGEIVGGVPARVLGRKPARPASQG